MIARQEAEFLIGALARGARPFELAGSPVYRPANTLRILDRLPLAVRAA